MSQIGRGFVAAFAAFTLLLAVAPAGAQPAPPSGPAVAGPANPPPWQKPGDAANRKRAACNAAWRRLHGRDGKTGTPAYFAFLDRCMKRR